MKRILACGALSLALLSSCKSKGASTAPQLPAAGEANDAMTQAAAASATKFEYFSEQFADLKVLRYEVPGFNELALKQKELLYYLYEAALSGRDILWDQNYRHNLLVRKTLEAIYQQGRPSSGAESWDEFVVYLKRVWFSNGIHHHYSNEKMKPGFDKTEFLAWLAATPKEKLPDVPDLSNVLADILFNPKIDSKKVNLDPKSDLIKSSATNYYESTVTQKEVERFYRPKTKKKVAEPVSWGLNSKLAKVNGKLEEQVWKVGGMYSPSIEKIVYWLEKAVAVAENPKQKKALQLLVDFYKSGDLRTFDEYSIAWVEDADSRIDVVNGFIEVYGDPMGYRGAYESVVSIRDLEASKRIAAIGNEAQWFEDNSPLMDAHKKKEVKGISAKVITVVIESGDAAPTTPIGINLPNANWIRAKHGSKSVNLGNIVHAHDESSKNSGIIEEFAFSDEEIKRAKKSASVGDILHTDLHEVIGHASGQINPGVGTPKETLKNYSSALEEGRADLVALYYLMDPKLIELGVMDSLDVGKSSYDDYIRNGLLVQLARLDMGANIEEAHMRNRQMIAKWAFEKGKDDNVIEKVMKEGKTYFVVRDYDALRTLFGELLREVQRIKSEGDYKAGKALVEGYGVKVDPAIHKEVKARYAALNIAPYTGFINPRLVPVKKDGAITDVKIEFPEDFSAQMLEYSKDYSLLPTQN